MSKKDIDIVKNIVIESLENLKTQDIVIIDVSKKSNFTDFLFIGTGTSSTHIKAIGSEVTENIKKNGYGRFIKGVESNGEWILIDLFDVVVNIMLNETRDFYSLEKLWSSDSSYSSKSSIA
jgi:ribosome-associated protein|tara:strand:+ start:14232 stop:14594 length:363 start_codon:yes stop_codon:yes gene_type:complete